MSRVWGQIAAPNNSLPRWDGSDRATAITSPGSGIPCKDSVLRRRHVAAGSARNSSSPSSWSSELVAERLHALSSEMTSELVAQSAVLSTEAGDLVAGGVESLA